MLGPVVRHCSRKKLLVMAAYEFSLCSVVCLSAVNPQDSLEEQAAAKRELRAELEAVQECLREKEAELEVTRGELLSKEGELRRLVQQWETREQEMGRMREEVLEGAREIAALQDKARTSGLGRGWLLGAGEVGQAEDLLGSVHLGAPGMPEEAAITRLELEVGAPAPVWAAPLLCGTTGVHALLCTRHWPLLSPMPDLDGGLGFEDFLCWLLCVWSRWQSWRQTAPLLPSRHFQT